MNAEITGEIPRVDGGLRVLERRMSDAVYRNLKADAGSNTAPPPGRAA